MAPRRGNREAAVQRADRELAEAERRLERALDEAERRAQSPANMPHRREFIAPDGSRHIFHDKPIDAFLDRAVVDRYNRAVTAWYNAHGWQGSERELREMLEDLVDEEDDFFDALEDDFFQHFMMGQPGPSRRPPPPPQGPRRPQGQAPGQMGNQEDDYPGNFAYGDQGSSVGQPGRSRRTPGPETGMPPEMGGPRGGDWPPRGPPSRQGGDPGPGSGMSPGMGGSRGGDWPPRGPPRQQGGGPGW